MTMKIESFIQLPKVKKALQSVPTDWETVYEQYIELPNNFTEYLVNECNIDPAEDLGYVPMNYFLDSTVTAYKIPENVTRIEQEAFSGSNIQGLYIPDSVKRIEQFVFAECDDLYTISLPRTLEFVGKGCFSGCIQLDTIVFRGTKSEFIHTAGLKWETGWNTSSRIRSITCDDGVITL